MRIALIYATWPEGVSGRSWPMMAAAFRDAGAAGRLAAAGHEVRETSLDVGPTQKDAFLLAGRIGDAVRAAIGEAALPVVICGSCTVAAVGGVAGLGPEAGIVWMDAHPDLSTPETTRSGLFEGMALTAATGLCWRGMAKEDAGLVPTDLSHAVLFGARDIDPPEAELIREYNIATVGSGDEAVAQLAARSALYIHLDMDVHDALRLRVNGFAVPGGPAPEDVGRALGTIGRGRPRSALAITGLEPDAPDGERGTSLAIGHILALANA
jgi:arginase